MSIKLTIINNKKKQKNPNLLILYLLRAKDKEQKTINKMDFENAAIELNTVTSSPNDGQGNNITNPIVIG